MRRTLCSIQAMTLDTQLQTERVARNTKQMVQLARQGHKESRTLKILAQSATMFLPPSLIAVRMLSIFKYSLVPLLTRVVNF